MKRYGCWLALLVALMIISIAGAIGCACAAYNVFSYLNIQDFLNLVLVGIGGTLLSLLSIGFLLGLIFLVLLMIEVFKDN